MGFKMGRKKTWRNRNRPYEVYREGAFCVRKSGRTCGHGGYARSKFDYRKRGR